MTMISDLSKSTYFKVLSNFLTVTGASISEDDFNRQEGIVELTTGNLILRVAPYVLEHDKAVEPDAIIIEVDLMLLDLTNREVNHDRFLILHQLNAVSRLTTGIIAFINEEGMLSISKMLSQSSLNEEDFLREVALVIQAGEDLYDGWNHLADLTTSTEAHEEQESSQQGDAPLSMDQKA